MRVFQAIAYFVFLLLLLMDTSSRGISVAGIGLDKGAIAEGLAKSIQDHGLKAKMIRKRRKEHLEPLTRDVLRFTFAANQPAYRSVITALETKGGKVCALLDISATASEKDVILTEKSVSSSSPLGTPGTSFAKTLLDLSLKSSHDFEDDAGAFCIFDIERSFDSDNKDAVLIHEYLEKRYAGIVNNTFWDFKTQQSTLPMPLQHYYLESADFNSFIKERSAADGLFISEADLGSVRQLVVEGRAYKALGSAEKLALAKLLLSRNIYEMYKYLRMTNRFYGAQFTMSIERFSAVVRQYLEEKNKLTGEFFLTPMPMAFLIHDMDVLSLTHFECGNAGLEIKAEDTEGVYHVSMKECIAERVYEMVKNLYILRVALLKLQNDKLSDGAFLRSMLEVHNHISLNGITMADSAVVISGVLGMLAAGLGCLCMYKCQATVRPRFTSARSRPRNSSSGSGNTSSNSRASPSDFSSFSSDFGGSPSESIDMACNV
ncbi:hypothetical protein PAPHI01_2265 [Pancytospora philotis]|nr:hypothetical protein PAPHI01_2265 [Pancytospora philotis]